MIGDSPANSSGRLLSVDGLINFRDIGGVDTTDGFAVRSGLLLRSASLDSITPQGVAELQEMGVRQVVDIRSAAEVDRHGRFPYEGTGIQWLHLDPKIGPPVAGVGDDALSKQETESQRILAHPDPMSLVFQFIIDRGGPAIGELIRVAADRERLPLVFHCTSGKDRTGVAAAMIQLLLGVGFDQVLADFRLSEIVLDAVHDDMIARYPEMRALPVEKVRRMAQADDAWLKQALDQAGGRTGPALTPWLNQNGVSADTIAQLRRQLISPRTG